MQVFLEWMRKRRATAKNFQVFGDSSSDELMAEELNRNGKRTKYVFVGDPDSFDKDKDRGYEVNLPHKKYDALTADYLRSQIAA